MKARKPRIEFVYGEGRRLSFLIDDRAEAERIVDTFSDGELDITVKRYKAKRSLTANAYFHCLCNEIARVIKSSDQEVKSRLVKDYGVPDRDEDGNLIYVILPKACPPERIDPYLVPIARDETRITYLAYKHTHEMTTQEFSRVVDASVEEAKELGIETLPPEELERLYATAQKHESM
jgi:hypothetical protein